MNARTRPTTAVRRGRHWLRATACATLGLAVLAMLGAEAPAIPQSGGPASLTKAATAAGGSRILFVRGTHVWSVRPDGGARQLTRAAVLQDDSPTWSPDHRSVAFVRTTGRSWNARRTSVWTMTATGGSQRKVVYRGPPISYSALAWSPDGRYLAGGNFTGSGGHASLLTWKTLRSRQVFTLEPSPNGIESLSWSPDSRQLLVAQEGGDSGWLMRVDARTGGLIKRYRPSVMWASWSPDGETIAYHVADTSTMERGIRLMANDGSSVRSLCDDGGTPLWSPDGTQIAYTVFTASGRSDLWLMNADGSAQHRILVNAWAKAWR